MTHLKIIVLIIFAAFYLTTSAQKKFSPGFIITMHNDTVYGDISQKSNVQNSKICEFKASNSSEVKKYKPSEIIGYRIINKKFYVSKKVEINGIKETVFLEFLLDGIINLYFIKATSEYYYFIEKDGKLMQLTNAEIEIVDEFGGTYSQNIAKYKGTLKYLFQEHPELYYQINNTEFSSKSLIKVTENYHNIVCTEYECVNYTKNSKGKWFIEFGGGINFSNMGLRTSSDKTFDTKPSAGIYFRYIPGSNNNVWNFVTGLNYTSNDFNGKFKNEIYGRSSNLALMVKYNMIKIPLTIDYTIPTGKLCPFLSFTANNVFTSNSSYNISNADDYYGQVDKGSGDNDILRTYQFGIAPALGIKYFQNSNHLFYLKAEYEYRLSVINANYILDNHYVKTIGISLGYGFRL